jgi:hypothetical protein
MIGSADGGWLPVEGAGKSAEREQWSAGGMVRSADSGQLEEHLSPSTVDSASWKNSQSADSGYWPARRTVSQQRMVANCKISQ